MICKCCWKEKVKLTPTHKYLKIGDSERIIEQLFISSNGIGGQSHLHSFNQLTLYKNDE
jgi:hypothetical protein